MRTVVCFAFLAATLSLAACASPTDDAADSRGAIQGGSATRTKLVPGHYVDPASGAALSLHVDRDRNQMMARAYFPGIDCFEIGAGSKSHVPIDVDVMPFTDGWDDWSQCGDTSFSARPTSDRNVELRWSRDATPAAPAANGTATLVRDRDAAVGSYETDDGTKLEVTSSDDEGATVRFSLDGQLVTLRGTWGGPIDLTFPGTDACPAGAWVMLERGRPVMMRGLTQCIR